MKHLILLFSLSIISFSLTGQIWNGQDTLYGNEWIAYEQSYFKIKIAEDGIYRLAYDQLQQAGIPIDQIQGQQLQLFHLGEQIPIHLSEEATWNTGDYLEFYGQKNRSELDRHLFTDPDTSLLNPEYSLITDSSAYYLTWSTNHSPIRYANVENDLSNLPTPESWYWAYSQKVFTQNHFKMYTRTSSVSIFYSHYDGNGFGNPYSKETIFNLDVSEQYEGGPTAELSVNLITNANPAGHDLQIKVNGNELNRDSFISVQVKKYKLPLASGSLSNETEVSIIGLNDQDLAGVALGKLRYPRNFRFSGQEALELELPAGNGARYLELEGLGNTPMIVLEPATNLRLLTSVTGNLHRIKLPAAPGPRKLILSVPSAVKTAPALEQVQFINYQAEDPNFLIITNGQLFDDGKGNNWVQAYADYRSSPEGGNKRVKILEVDQLFDQFAYGIDYHPLSIRNAFTFLRKYRYPNLEFIFIMGRGQEYSTVRKEEDLRAAITVGNMLVPSFGFPASDNLLFTSNEGRVSPVPVGRLAAVNGDEVKIYLDKVKAFEESANLPQTVTDRAWTKHILHLGGGSRPVEQIYIRNNLESLAQEIEQSPFGGSVRAFYKNSTDVIQNSLSQEIFDYINSGTSMITFYGHSSPGTFDFNIDNPDNYENEGKYPFILSLGCYSGNLFAPSRSIGERFTFYEDKAAILFAASRGLGFISSLGAFAKTFYKNIGEEYYGKSVGESMRATCLAYEDNTSLGLSILVQQFTIHGDPSIRLYPVEGPDFVVDASSTEFSPQLVSTQMDSFTIAFDVLNLGRNDYDTISLELSRTFPGWDYRGPDQRHNCHGSIPEVTLL